MIHMNCKDTDQMVEKMEESLALEKVLELEVALESALEVIDNIFALFIQVINKIIYMVYVSVIRAEGFNDQLLCRNLSGRSERLLKKLLNKEMSSLPISFRIENGEIIKINNFIK
ncbi:hypothetical protein BpHYR1_005811 [Brachionus plicatilis]|uniref:Uncharacterized protein n=1 Tax=Brachionus plicatilis TaxID=10195 RepID=A0A3M7QEZ6_BRAPC|nr:hypothetical protein BpHYR1_005811 [Brachionus plicatilis]